MLSRAVRMARDIAALKRRTAALGIPTVYVNDNFGRWRSDFRRTVAHCLGDDVRGRPVVELLVPDENDYFVLKPRCVTALTPAVHRAALAQMRTVLKADVTTSRSIDLARLRRRSARRARFGPPSARD